MTRLAHGLLLLITTTSHNGTLTTWLPLAAKVGTNFADKGRSLGRYSFRHNGNVTRLIALWAVIGRSRQMPFVSVSIDGIASVQICIHCFCDKLGADSYELRFQERKIMFQERRCAVCFGSGESLVSGAEKCGFRSGEARFQWRRRLVSGEGKLGFRSKDIRFQRQSVASGEDELGFRGKDVWFQRQSVVSGAEKFGFRVQDIWFQQRRSCFKSIRFLRVN
jgi:hypothetical protein